jgi:hypothetical protein
MTTIAPAAVPGTLRFYIARAAFYARVVAVLLSLVVAGRFGVAALSRALDVSTGQVATRPEPHVELTPAILPEPSAMSSARRAALEPVPTAPLVNAGKAVRVTLGIDYGTPRSEVYVNGRMVGNTPFLGDTSCKLGQPLKIELVPAKGPPLTYERQCLGGSLDITTAPP